MLQANYLEKKISLSGIVSLVGPNMT